ncbi:MAG: 2-dehydro-3-deoxyphosphooctonate aldolase (KDO 8-P synthase) [Saprospiraceae bacterium]|jgi:2-dehydro-3-deoxyphosphooctonate aldolase (KDO 8-P synthase)
MNDLTRIIEGGYDSFFLIAGPCAVESLEVCRSVASHLIGICEALDIPFVFKASFRKANRTAGSSFRGIGDDEALDILRSIREEFQIPITTDVHEIGDVESVRDIVDIIQIPAFLCRQTALLEAAAATGRPVNIKKGQFMSVGAMSLAVEKVSSIDSQKVFLTERGNSFGYNDLIVDARNIAQMALITTTIMDCTHSSQRPNQSSGITGGNPAEIELFAKLGLVSGAKGLFIEMHPDTSRALSDGASMLPLVEANSMLSRLTDLSLNYNQIYASTT